MSHPPPAADNDLPALFTPFAARGLTLPNRIVISPMQQYAAGADGRPTDYHLIHYGRLALGRPGLIFTEALCIAPEGRLTYSDLGIWDDGAIAPLGRLVEAMRAEGVVPGAQILHAGRKASVQRPWQGYEPLREADLTERGEAPWPTVAPSAIAANPGWPVPRELTLAEIPDLVEQHGAAARRCAAAGFAALDIHGAHGYLIHTFLSPLSNRRDDAYGGDLDGRMRFALEVAEAVRANWPAERPLFYRLSCIDDEPGGWSLEDTIRLARELRAQGVDVIDCSSRGLGQRGTPVVAPRQQGFQVPFAEAVRRRAEVASMTVGLIIQPAYAEAVVAEGRADLIAIGREALVNPQWPLHAALELIGDGAFDSHWQPRYGWWLSRRAKSLAAARDEAQG
ncbi:MAG: NADH:flavin oxidoreductase/NADH oxidase [Alphaproteobacteria bacterium]|jgi:2,4-dienoyl-CoA reductase-like NADH-dependent reductase (Old Yellow Enzyme family)|nr:NADH:flavin oxidoreductase/NADH oxidase [Alphaproteobacteria bacterium]MDP6814394.1 NADH:flavin oxidoreductase/NADH oxidase [Alphaproteobacteria bacterium]